MPHSGMIGPENINNNALVIYNNKDNVLASGGNDAPWDNIDRWR
jgi:hypothetical protein